MSHDAASGEPATRNEHDASWSANLEGPEHAMDRDLIVEQSKDAISETVAGYHVNLITHGEHGHPETYLWDELEAAFDGIRLEYVDRCGCGGHVTRVHVGAE
ncbi:CGCGG family rSAM-modified RiPP protein [Natrinema longum]|uniref:CGCGG family rSAM-modified RiPP protein n=1 Tax=Natrinema longum TaxID=370324 RepID=A0A8A2UAR6_9EURY|nr:CGCGG family rSAM-modified RiPP protein [Natrinema longum]MBZ6496297.1 CGCGG family rSAM-modified RiPP protein [Natrinema longum]QSW85786.1 CGCGG family rSAM-modified RiPP protein [Natrinema longum]